LGWLPFQGRGDPLKRQSSAATPLIAVWLLLQPPCKRIKLVGPAALTSGLGISSEAVSSAPVPLLICCDSPVSLGPFDRRGSSREESPV